MMQKLCDWTESKNGAAVCGVLMLVGGLHMMFSDAQPVLGMLDLGSLTFMGRDIGVQTVLGLALVLCAGGCLMSGSDSMEMTE